MISGQRNPSSFELFFVYSKGIISLFTVLQMYSLSLDCRSLTVTFRGVDFFEFILFGFHSVSWICILCLPLNLWSFPPSFLSALFLSSFLASSIILSMCLSIYRGRDFKELAHTFVKAWQIQNRQGRLAGWKPEKTLSSSPKLSAGRIPSLSGDVIIFILRLQMIVYSPLTLWGIICFTQSLLI